MISDCRFDLLEKISRYDVPGCADFIPLNAIRAALPAYDEESVKTAVHDLCSMHFVELKDGRVAITEMGIAAMCSL
ncbi:hypothetical protein [Breoghania sp.]|uniref:hypothetical protein n=1 Tax=Breoghania sp. TaxID=2065378 RepID=UPI002AA6EBC3|nr:hypothetical protein [Breoghania sp.]